LFESFVSVVPLSVEMRDAMYWLADKPLALDAAYNAFQASGVR
jgi:hypothetical protein